MSRLLYSAFFLVCFLGMITGLEAQPVQKTEPKFIEGLEISPVIHPTNLNTPVQEEKPKFRQLNTKNEMTAGPVKIEYCKSLQFKYGILLDREVESISNLALYGFIEDWLGTSYHYGGQGENGIDCSAFAAKLYSKVFTLELPRTSVEQYQGCQNIPMSEMNEGDLVFFKIRHGISHVGVYLGNNYFVHSSVHDGVIISSLNDPYYQRKFASAGRIIK